MKHLIAIAFISIVSTLALAQTPSVVTIAGGDGDTNALPQTTPDNRPLTGVRNLGLGSDSEHDNQLAATLSVSESGMSNPQFASSTGDNWTSVSSVSGSAILSRSTRLSATDLSYRGTGSFYNSESYLNSQTQLFGIAESVRMRRWTVTLADNLNYLPEGQGGLPQSGLSGGNGADLGSQYLPNGSILTPGTTQLSNAAVAELDYNFTRNTSLSLNGSYALLDYPNTVLLNTTQRTFGGGLNHSYGRNTAGVSCTNTMFRYQNQPQSSQTDSCGLNFARRVSARYSVEAYAGPEMLVSKVGNQDTTQYFASGHFALRWRGMRTTTSLAYSHSVTGGSGVVQGAKTDQVMADINRMVTRTVTLNGSVAYARNAATLVGETYDTINAMGGISRRVWVNASMAMSYFYQRQISNGSLYNLQNQVIMFTFTWNFRPVHFK